MFFYWCLNTNIKQFKILHHYYETLNDVENSSALPVTERRKIQAWFMYLGRGCYFWMWTDCAYMIRSDDNSGEQKPNCNVSDILDYVPWTTFKIVDMTVYLDQSLRDRDLKTLTKQTV